MTLVPGITMAIPQAIVFGIISGCMGVLGDLAESRIKRNSGFKDSGTIMPGHGGLLDRCEEVYVYEKMRDAALDLSHHMGYTEVKLPTGRTHL